MSEHDKKIPSGIGPDMSVQRDSLNSEHVDVIPTKWNAQWLRNDLNHEHSERKSRIGY